MINGGYARGFTLSARFSLCVWVNLRASGALSALVLSAEGGARARTGNVLCVVVEIWASGACGSACGVSGMEELHLITEKGAEPSAVKRLLGAVADLRSSQVLRAAFGHLSLFGALVAYTALGGLVSKLILYSSHRFAGAFGWRAAAKLL